MKIAWPVDACDAAVQDRISLPKRGVVAARACDICSARAREHALCEVCARKNLTRAGRSGGHTMGSHGGGALYKPSFVEDPWAALEV